MRSGTSLQRAIQCLKCGDFYTDGEQHNCGRSEQRMRPASVCGWLVCLGAPQLGRGFRLVEGKNTLGGQSCDVSLSFDPSIDSNASAAIAFDPVGGVWFLLNLGGRNLLRVGGNLLISIMTLQGGEILEIGNQRLRFVPFCGDQFQWG